MSTRCDENRSVGRPGWRSEDRAGARPEQTRAASESYVGEHVAPGKESHRPSPREYSKAGLHAMTGRNGDHVRPRPRDRQRDRFRPRTMTQRVDRRDRKPVATRRNGVEVDRARIGRDRARDKRPTVETESDRYDAPGVSCRLRSKIERARDGSALARVRNLKRPGIGRGCRIYRQESEDGEGEEWKLGRPGHSEPICINSRKRRGMSKGTSSEEASLHLEPLRQDAHRMPHSSVVWSVNYKTQKTR